MTYSADYLDHQGAFLVDDEGEMTVAGALGFTGDRPFFLYWQAWVMGLAALGLGLFLGAAF